MPQEQNHMVSAPTSMEAAHLIAQVQQLDDLLLTRQGESELLADACDAHDNLRTVKGTTVVRIIRPELGAGECTAGRLVGDQALGPMQARELGSAELLRGGLLRELGGHGRPARLGDVGGGRPISGRVLPRHEVLGGILVRVLG